MGWNDNVDLIEMECLDCGEIETWTVWNAVAHARYGGKNKPLGDFLGIDEDESDRCPFCGSTNGKPIDEDDY